MNARLGFMLVLALALLCCGCHLPSEPPGTHPAHGVVKAITSDRLSATIQHDRVPSLDMDAMTMDFKMKDAHVLDHVNTGDTVDFDIETGGPQGAVVSRVSAAKR